MSPIYDGRLGHSALTRPSSVNADTLLFLVQDSPQAPQSFRLPLNNALHSTMDGCSPYRDIDSQQFIHPQDLLAQPPLRKTCACQLPSAVQQDGTGYNLSQDDGAKLSTSEVLTDTRTC